VLAERGVLGQLRGLLNLEYEDKRLLSVVLVGPPALDEALALDPALADRVDIRVVLPAFPADVAARYLAHRIRAAEGNPAILESSAIAALAKWGAGNPRRLNTLADNALFEAHLAGRVGATAADVERAAAELGLDTPGAAAPASGVPREVPVETPAASATAAEPTPREVAPPPGPEPGASPTSADAPSAAADGTPSDDRPTLLLEGEELTELDEVVADDTKPPVGVAHGAEAATRGGAPGATTASPGDTDGELDDLFADLVDE